MSDLRLRLRLARAEVGLAVSLRALPWPVARFVLRGRRHARRANDRFSLDSAARPAELRALIDLARGRREVVELGTGTAWTAIALALADRRRRIRTYDPAVRAEREHYMRLAGASVRARIELREEPDHAGPRRADPATELLFIDSSHDRDPTVAAFRAWRSGLADGAVVVFHDHGHPSYPGVAQAIEALGLSGESVGGMFVWRAPSS